MIFEKVDMIYTAKTSWLHLIADLYFTHICSKEYSLYLPTIIQDGSAYTLAGSQPFFNDYKANDHKVGIAPGV